MPPPQVAEQGPHSPVFHLQVTESSKQIMAQRNWPEAQRSASHPCCSKTRKTSLCRRESETSSCFTKRCLVWLAMQSMSPTPEANPQLQNTCYSGNAELSLRGRFISMAFGFLTSAKTLCLEWNTKKELKQKKTKQTKNKQTKKRKMSRSAKSSSHKLNNPSCSSHHPKQMSPNWDLNLPANYAQLS